MVFVKGRHTCGFTVNVFITCTDWDEYLLARWTATCTKKNFFFSPWNESIQLLRDTDTGEKRTLNKKQAIIMNYDIFQLQSKPIPLSFFMLYNPR